MDSKYFPMRFSHQNFNHPVSAVHDQSPPIGCKRKHSHIIRFTYSLGRLLRQTCTSQFRAGIYTGRIGYGLEFCRMAKRIFRRYLSLHGSDMSQEYLTGTIPDRIHAAPARLHMHIDKDLSAFGIYAARI